MTEAVGAAANTLNEEQNIDKSIRMMAVVTAEKIVDLLQKSFATEVATSAWGLRDRTHAPQVSTLEEAWRQNCLQSYRPLISKAELDKSSATAVIYGCLTTRKAGA